MFSLIERMNGPWSGHESHCRKTQLPMAAKARSRCWLYFQFLKELPSEKAMAPHSNTLACKIPWTEEPGRLQSMGSLITHRPPPSEPAFCAQHRARGEGRWQWACGCGGPWASALTTQGCGRCFPRGRTVTERGWRWGASEGRVAGAAWLGGGVRPVPAHSRGDLMHLLGQLCFHRALFNSGSSFY